MGCLEAIEALYAYLDGELDDPASIADFEHHMGHCSSCCSRAEVETMLTDRIRKSANNQAPDELQIRLRKLMDDFE
jgi:anti-sigma factor (TIGR02949 family)